MRIGRLFAVSMLSVTVLAVVLGAGVLVPQYRTFASKTEAIKAVEAYGTVLANSQQRTSSEGCVSFFNIGTPTSTFHANVNAGTSRCVMCVISWIRPWRVLVVWMLLSIALEPKASLGR